MTDPQSDNPAPDAWRFNPRAFLAREWPYLLMLILALFGVAYTSFSKTPMTMYWIALAPFIGVICVVTRWRDAENREQRLRLIWTQALHWGAVLLAMHLMFVADVSRMMNADGSALAALTVLALGTFTAGVHIGAWRICLVGIVLGVGVPAIAWLEQSALLLWSSFS
jgi:threonine/homoserine efflux transporter RhtA